MRDRFSDGEWVMLTAMPMLLLRAMMAADGNLEKYSFGSHFRGESETKNELHRLLLESFMEDVFQNLENVETMEEAGSGAWIGTFKNILETNLDEDEYQEFMGDMFFTIGWAYAVDDLVQAELEVMKELILLFNVDTSAISAAAEGYGAVMNFDW